MRKSQPRFIRIHYFSAHDNKIKYLTINIDHITHFCEFDILDGYDWQFYSSGRFGVKFILSVPNPSLFSFITRKRMEVIAFYPTKEARLKLLDKLETLTMDSL